MALIRSPDIVQNQAYVKLGPRWDRDRLRTTDFSRVMWQVSDAPEVVTKKFACHLDRALTRLSLRV
jgi:hypothetical protein